MAYSIRSGLAFALALILISCNPQEQLGVGVDDETDIPGDGTPTFSGLTFSDGKLLVSKAISRDLFGGLGPGYCFDNSDSRYGCETLDDPSNTKPVFIRSLKFSLMIKSEMFGISKTEDLAVTFPGATVISAIPSLNPDTGDFVYTRRERWRYNPGALPADPSDDTWTKIVSSSDTSCVPGTNGAVGFNDRAGYALNGLHVFEEGIDYSTSMAGLYSAKFEGKYIQLSENDDGELESSAETSFDVIGLKSTSALFGATLQESPEFKANPSGASEAGHLPRVITGFCIRSAKTAPATPGIRTNPLIRVGLFGLRGVFYKARFR